MWTTRLPAYRRIVMRCKPETMLRIIAQVKREGYSFAVLPTIGLTHIYNITIFCYVYGT